MRSKKYEDKAVAIVFLIAAALVVIVGTRLSISMQHAHLSSIDMLQ